MNEFLSPVDYNLQEYARSLGKYMIGNSIQFDLPESHDKLIVLLSIPEYRPKDSVDIEDFSFTDVRRTFYQLSKSNWSVPIIDLGVIKIYDTYQETYFALHNCLQELQHEDITIIILSGSQAQNYITFKSIGREVVDYVSIDKKLDLDTFKQDLTNTNYLSKMMMDDEIILNAYCNLGTQVPYNQKEAYDLIDQLTFDEVSLGKLINNLHESEPYLREADMVSIDLSSLQESTFTESYNTSNGFTSREICNIMKYAGLNKRLKVLSIDNYYPNGCSQSASLIAEMIWYFIEAQNNQYPIGKLEVYRVQQEEEIVFYKSTQSEQWWLQILIDSEDIRVPCSEKDYLSALKGNKPDKLLRFYKKYF